MVLPVEGVAEGVAAAAVVAAEAEGGADGEVGLGGVLGDDEVELELIDGGRGGKEVGLVLLGQLVGGGEDRRGGVDLGEVHGADRRIELELADEGEQGVLPVLRGLLGEDDVAAGVGDADLGRQHIEVGGDAGVAAGLGLVVKAVGEGEGGIPHRQLLAGEGEVVVGVLGGLDDVQHLGLEVEVGALEQADLGAVDGGPVDLGAEAGEQLLADGEGQIGVVGGIERDEGGIGRAAVEHAAGAEGGAGVEPLAHAGPQVGRRAADAADSLLAGRSRVTES